MVRLHRPVLTVLAARRNPCRGSTPWVEACVARRTPAASPRRKLDRGSALRLPCPSGGRRRTGRAV